MEKLFRLSERKTNVRTEVLAGITTFLTMAYIIVVNPQLLSQAGMSFAGVLFATILVCAFSSIFMGLYANLPYGLAPGMSINAFFTFTLVLSMGVPWQTALGAVFVSGIIFIILSVTKVRTIIVKAVPTSLRYAIAAGIGLFLTLIGLTSIGFIVTDETTTVSFGGLNVSIVLFVIGLLLTSVLLVKKVRGALILGIIGTSILAAVFSLVGVAAGFLASPIVSMPKGVFALPSLEVLFKLDIRATLTIGMLGPVFTLLFTDLFDSISTFLGVAQAGGLLDKEGQPINVGRAMLVDAFSTTFSGLFGTSSGTTYIESAAGIEEGGRTGLTAVVTGLLFLPFMFLSPLLAFIPAVATAPVLVLIGVFMAKPLTLLDWKNYEEAVPAFVAAVLIPLTYSITQGIVWGFLVYTFIKILVGKAREIHWMLYIIDAFAILSLVLPLIQGS